MLCNLGAFSREKKITNKPFIYMLPKGAFDLQHHDYIYRLISCIDVRCFILQISEMTEVVDWFKYLLNL